jgi:hypothetical protein
MKKITLIFTAFLIIPIYLFGQIKEPKLLWEAESPFPFSEILFNNPSFFTKSKLGRILTATPYGLLVRNSTNQIGTGINIFDTNGKRIYNHSSFYTEKSENDIKPVSNGNYVLMYCTKSLKSDSVVYCDNEFNIIRRFDTHLATMGVFGVSDGIIYNDAEGKLIKYNLKGDIEWQNLLGVGFKILNNSTPYIALAKNTNGQSYFVTIDKNGKKIGESEPTDYQQFVPTRDKGFWINTPIKNNQIIIVKFDSTAKKISSVKIDDVSASIITASENDILMAHQTIASKILLSKVNTDGSIKTIETDVDLNGGFNLSLNDVIFNSLYSNDENQLFGITVKSFERRSEKRLYGACNFKTNKLNWSKSLDNAQNGKTAFLANNDKVNIEVSDGQNLNYFDANGLMLANYDGYQSFKRIDNLLYVVNAQKELLQIDLKKFSLNWKSESTGGFRSLQQNKNGKILMINYTNLNYDFSVLDKEKGTLLWKQTKVDSANNIGYLEVLFNDDDTFYYLGMTSKNTNGVLNLYTNLRKITPRCNYSFTPKAEAFDNKTEVCPNETVKLLTNRLDDMSLQWQKDGKDLLNLKDGIHDVNESGVYKVFATDNLCKTTTTSNEIKVVIRPLATVEIKTPIVIFCEGLKTTITSATNGTFFQWQKDGKDIPKEISSTFEATQSGDYRVGVRDDKCPQVSFSKSLTISVKPLPEAIISTDIKGVLYAPFTLKLNANTGIGLNYQWQKDEKDIPNANTTAYESATSGKYAVKVTKDGCLKISEPLTVSILVPLAISETKEEIVDIFPNPNNGTFNLIIPQALKEADIKMYDSLGRERNFENNNDTIQAQNLAKGIYYLKVSKDSKSVTSKVIIQ